MTKPIDLNARRVLAKAFVDVHWKPAGGKVTIFKVTTWGTFYPQMPTDGPEHVEGQHVIVYTIKAKSDNVAASEGIRRFVQAMLDRAGALANGRCPHKLEPQHPPRA